YVRRAPAFLVDAVPHHLKMRFEGAQAEGPYQWHFVEHHTAHAASAYLASPFERSAIMTLDGRGEQVTTSYGVGAGTRMERVGQVMMPHSVGLLYEDVTS